MTSRSEPADLSGAHRGPAHLGGAPRVPAPPRLALDLTRRRAPSEIIVQRLFQVFAFLSILTTAGIILVLFGESLVFFQEVPLSAFFGDTQWTPLFHDPHFGIWPLLCGTLLTTVIALTFAVPCGILAAVYLSELASPRTRAWAKPALEVLAGVPTVVFGYFALSIVTPSLQSVIPGLSGANALSAGLVMGLMILPIIASISEDAIYAVPQSFREGAAALAGTKVRTIWRVVLPGASSGITAAIILGVSRAVGETMIVAIAAGLEPRMTIDPREPVETMTAYIVQVSLGDTPAGSLAFQTIFAVGLVLFLMTFGFNALSHRLRKKIQRGTL